VPATVDDELTYKELFDGLEVCSGLSKYSTTGRIYQNGINLPHPGVTPICTVTYDEKTFKAGKPTGKEG